MNDLIGLRFGKLRVLAEDASLAGNFVCRCECGNELSLAEDDLRGGKARNCGCAEPEKVRNDITGMRSGQLLAIEPTEMKRRGTVLWRCRCDCGNELLTEAYKISRRKTQSCGCSRKGKNMAEIAGQRFGRLVALERLNAKRGSSYLWRCRCDCGREIETTANALLSGNSKSCGCARREAIQRMHENRSNIADRLRLVDGTSLDRIELGRLQKNNTSGCTGVQKRGSRWVAVIGFKGESHYLGIFGTYEEAVKARRDAEKRYFGEFIEEYYKDR